eukprot:COSAG01_NODE_4548_length_4932_cov_3.672460_3_plen_477_part_00
MKKAASKKQASADRGAAVEGLRNVRGTARRRPPPRPHSCPGSAQRTHHSMRWLRLPCTPVVAFVAGASAAAPPTPSAAGDSSTSGVTVQLVAGGALTAIVMAAALFGLYVRWHMLALSMLLTPASASAEWSTVSALLEWASRYMDPCVYMVMDPYVFGGKSQSVDRRHPDGETPRVVRGGVAGAAGIGAAAATAAAQQASSSVQARGTTCSPPSSTGLPPGYRPRHPRRRGGPSSSPPTAAAASAAAAVPAAAAVALGEPAPRARQRYPGEEEEEEEEVWRACQAGHLSCPLELPTAKLRAAAYAKLGETAAVRARALAELRQRCARAELEGGCGLLIGVGGGRGAHGSEADDRFLLAFLRAKRFDVDRALKMIIKYTRLVRQVGNDDEIVRANDGAPALVSLSLSLSLSLSVQALSQPAPSWHSEPPSASGRAAGPSSRSTCPAVAGTIRAAIFLDMKGRATASAARIPSGAWRR